MKQTTKETLVEVLFLAWVAGVSAFNMWSYKQNQIDVLKAEHHGELKAVEHARDRAESMLSAKEVSNAYLQERLNRTNDSNEALTTALEEATDLVKRQREKISEQKQPETPIFKVTVPLQNLRSAKKFHAYLDEFITNSKKELNSVYGIKK